MRYEIPYNDLANFTFSVGVIGFLSTILFGVTLFTPFTTMLLITLPAFYSLSHILFLVKMECLYYGEYYKKKKIELEKKMEEELINEFGPDIEVVKKSLNVEKNVEGKKTPNQK